LFWAKSAEKNGVFSIVQAAPFIYAKRQAYAHARVYN
jgi:hypothetical protein